MKLRFPILLLGLVACEVEPIESDDPIDGLDPDPDPEPELGDIQTLTVDATDRENFVYVDLDTATVLDASAADGTDWDLAIRRFEIRTNGGTSGSGTAESGLAFEPPGLFDADGEPILAEFQALDPDNTVDWLTGEIDDGEMEADNIPGVFAEDWFNYDFATGIATPNPDVGWVVRGAEGTSYARVRMTQLDFPTREGMGIKSFTVTVELEDTDGFAAPLTFEGSVPGEGGSVCFDMDTDTNVECTDPSWDLQLGFSGRNTFLYTNSGGVGDGMGGALGPYDWTELSTWTSASTNPGGQDLSTRFESDVSESAMSIEPWFAYNLQGQFQLYPTFRVYAVSPSEDGPLWALQVTDYYDDDQVGGNVTLRWVER
ncbi:MAG: HmuY family protein [Myxococcota bacterium]